MTQHEYISIAIAIILGLAITRLLHTAAMIIRIHKRVVFHWASAAWAFCVMLYILQFWWVGWGLRAIDQWNFQNFIVLVFGCTFLYGAAEMALTVPAEPASTEDVYDMLKQSQQFGRLSAASMLMYFLVGPYVNIVMYNNAVMPSVAVPSAGILLMLLTIFVPAHFRIWSALFVCYTLGILLLTI
jgi:hypothetical protein